MEKAFVIHVQPVGGSPVAEAGESLDELISKAKEVRRTGLFKSKPAKSVTVFSSESYGGPVLRYKCDVEKPVEKKPKAK